MISFIWSSKKDKIIYHDSGQNNDRLGWVPTERARKTVFFWVVVTQHVYAETHCTTYLGFVHFTVCKVYLSNKVTEINEASNFKILVISIIWTLLKLFYSVLFYL